MKMNKAGNPMSLVLSLLFPGRDKNFHPGNKQDTYISCFIGSGKNGVEAKLTGGGK
jgi:hypothetical protein